MMYDLNLELFNKWLNLNPQVKDKSTFQKALMFFLEETQELQDNISYEKGDIVINERLFDDLGDSLFTLIQLFAWLNLPMQSILDEVCSSNLTKFTTCYPCIKDEANKLGYTVIEREYQGTKYYAMVDENGKIRKPSWFTNVNFKQLL